MRNVVHVVLAAALASAVMAGSTAHSNAAARPRPSRAFDGLWSVSIVTYNGDCDRGYRYPLRIWEGQVLKADNDPNYTVAGAVARSGAIGVTISGGGQSANGTGRLRGNAGAGIWQTSNGHCSGRWTAERRRPDAE
ncbi:MAG TPA: hypothetical protein VMF12_10745 [Xanthobacteraceae bacterium]|nr:hypothetical protein [Xanthobacteraceae bacterium]